MTKKLDITSTVAENVINTAKSFLGKLIGPAVSETGLLFKDKVSFWRFNNQLKIILRAKEKCEKHGINPKSISFKILCPLLEYASMEDNEEAQDIWANLLINMVDSEQNIQNHVFPYILSQVSINEFSVIEEIFNINWKRKEKHQKEIELLEDQLVDLQKMLDFELIERNKDGDVVDLLDDLIFYEKGDTPEKLREIKNKINFNRYFINSPCRILKRKLANYEEANLVRLGVLKSIMRPHAYVAQNSIPQHIDGEDLNLQDLQIHVENKDEDLIITELGEMFLKACLIKMDKRSKEPTV
ncbi:Abi-alpha family protein [Flavobacterium cerinum]|uniref:DUF4393 domain-containing protein n=1 Tax=Flavobacterium cerinum TaxID=2502784 RepID=A0ABY5IPH8_9FLAO|nr:Abi-alpha family protein [Flavobacterium cerinum]UUC44186.1 DUF4393 domain-containing protein [Flavobacterium cerinum]